MKIKNGYIWSNKQGRWRKLPHKVWLRLQWQQKVGLQRKKQAEREEQ
jgi:hypothetical protein